MPDSSELPIGDNPGISVPQFATAEYGGTERCARCGNIIAGQYYRVASKLICTSCEHALQGGLPVDSHSAFVRGILLGSGAAIVALTAYAAFTIMSGFYLGYVALAVGWFVAKAIEKGSGGLGGRRYQIAAVALTYCAISLAAIPIWFASVSKEQSTATKQSAAVANPDRDAAESSSEKASGAHRPTGLVPLLGQLLFIGLASPFLELASPIQGAIGLFILFIGLRIAWRMTAAKRIPIDGPFPLAAP